ncbi:MAG: bifunctional hydroxymethylpyrimidine kinase/phosphomethylpyrimidine kinase [Anaerotardibacter sp.]
MKSVLTIAGSDTSGGAGIQADLKTMSALGVYGQSAITALTAQNTLGVQGVSAVDPEFLRQQIESVFADIVPDAVKIGMIPTPELVGVVADCLELRGPLKVVLDPVMVATSGSALSDSDSVRALVARLIPLATVLTPNIPETEALLEYTDYCWSDSSHTLKTEEDIQNAAQALLGLGCQSVLIKGGHAVNDANDYYLDCEGNAYWLRTTRIDTENTHGTGCTLSSAIASFLAKGNWPIVAAHKAKGYLTGALSSNLSLGKGNGPVNHLWALHMSEVEFAKELATRATIEKISE